MEPFEIVCFPDPRLREVCEPISNIDDALILQIERMCATMYDAHGIGLAAPQIGDNRRVIVVDTGHDPEQNTRGPLYKLINPEIIKQEGRVDSEEGCLSIPGIRETIKRSENIIVRAMTPEEKEITLEASGLLAICLQHEIDHINGILFIDHLGKVKRELAKARYKKFIREQDKP